MRAYTTARNRALPIQSFAEQVKDLETGWRSLSLRGFTLAQLIPRADPRGGGGRPIHDSEEKFIASLDRSEAHDRAYFSKYKRVLPTTKRYLEIQLFNYEWHAHNAEAWAKSVERSDKREKREKAKWAAEHATRLAAMSPAELKEYRETPT